MALRTRLTGTKTAVGIVCLLVATAGCYAFLDTGQPGRDVGGGDGGGPTTSSPATDDAGLPPGITGETLTDGDALVRAHREHLASEGFVYAFVHNQTDGRITPGGDLAAVERTIDARGDVRAGPDLSVHARRVDREAPVEKRVSRWTNGTAGARRVQQGGTTYGQYTASASPRLTHHYLIPQMVARQEWSVESQSGDRVVLTADAHPQHGDLQAFEGRMVVDSQGRIHRLSVTVTTSEIRDHEGETVQFEVTRRFVYELQQVGNVSVPPPDWLDEARDGTAEG